MISPVLKKYLLFEVFFLFFPTLCVDAATDAKNNHAKFNKHSP